MSKNSLGKKSRLKVLSGWTGQMPPAARAWPLKLSVLLPVPPIFQARALFFLLIKELLNRDGYLVSRRGPNVLGVKGGGS